MLLWSPASTRHMEVDVLLAEPMYLKEVVEHADYGIGSLTDINCLINKVVE